MITINSSNVTSFFFFFFAFFLFMPFELWSWESMNQWMHGYNILKCCLFELYILLWLKKKCIKLLKLSFLILAKFFERLQQIEKFLRKNCILIGWKYYWNQLCWLIWEKKFLIALLQRFIIDAVSGSLDLYFIFLSKILFLRHFEYFCIWMVLVYIELQF